MGADISKWFEGKSFSSDWTTPHIATWTSNFAARRHSIVDALEIGSWEGRSTIFWLNYFPVCRVTCIDDYSGSAEHQSPEMAGVIAALERTFDQNVAEYSPRVEKIKSRSWDALAVLGVAGRRFDFVYVDGSHRALDVYGDAALAWPMVKAGGVMLFDDYTWQLMPDERDRPKLGIDAFLWASRGTYRELHRELQILIEKSVVAE